MSTQSERDAPEATDAPPDDGERTQRPWPYWMARYLGSDDVQAMNDLIWSVGGSPPYGGVSWEEAEAVYELLEAYRSPKPASEAHYDKLRRMLASRPDRLAVVDLFHCADEIQSAPTTYGREPVDHGLALARRIGHRGAQASFLAFLAGWLFQAGELAAGADHALQALEIFLELAEQDVVYEKRVRQIAQNAVAMTATAGDKQRARQLLQQLTPVMEPVTAEQFRRALQ